MEEWQSESGEDSPSTQLLQEEGQQSPPASPSFAPGQAIFADDEETESFYITLDVTANDFKPEENPSSPTTKEPTSNETLDADDNEDNDASLPPRVPPMTTDATTTTMPREPIDLSRVQILGLHTKCPKVKYGNSIFSCDWHEEIGTELFFLPPVPIEADHNANKDGDDDDDDDDDGEEEEAEVRMGNATFLGKSRLRLEGSIAKVLPIDMIESKAEISALSGNFKQGFEAALERRLAREEREAQAAEREILLAQMARQEEARVGFESVMAGQEGEIRLHEARRKDQTAAGESTLGGGDGLSARKRDSLGNTPGEETANSQDNLPPHKRARQEGATDSTLD